MEKKSRKGFWVLIITVVIFVALLIIFVPMKSITCYRTETTIEQVPYSTTEYYWDKEPYSVCAGTSWWTGDCNSWRTEYRDVQKSRTVIKYTDEEKQIQVPYSTSVNWIFGTC